MEKKKKKVYTSMISFPGFRGKTKGKGSYESKKKKEDDQDDTEKK